MHSSKPLKSQDRAERKQEEHWKAKDVVSVSAQNAGKATLALIANCQKICHPRPAKIHQSAFHHLLPRHCQWKRSKKEKWVVLVREEKKNKGSRSTIFKHKLCQFLEGHFIHCLARLSREFTKEKFREVWPNFDEKVMKLLFHQHHFPSKASDPNCV